MATPNQSDGKPQPGNPLLKQIMCGGWRIIATALADIRNHVAANLASLPEPLRRLQEPCDCRAEIASALHKLAEQVDWDLFDH